MSKYKLKSGVSGKAMVFYRTPKKGGMQKVLLESATQAQLKELASIGHPFVEVEKKVVKKPAPDEKD